MLTDARGLTVTTDDPAVVAAIDRYAEAFFAYTNDAPVILEAVVADPVCPLAQAYAGALYLFLESRAGPAEAEPHIAAAETAIASTASGATERERLWVTAVRAWADGRLDTAIDAHKAITARWPEDLLAAKVGQYHLFNQGRCRELCAMAEAVLPANRDVGYAHGMLAFGLEQTHRLAEAEAAGRHATDLNRTDPWAHHAVAHVMETQGRVAEGIAWMRGLADAWADCNSFMLTHNWWHVALFHLDRDDAETALGLYDERVWGVWKAYSQDQIGAVSLLARLELRGVDVGDRWQDVATHMAASDRAHDHVNGFLDLQYLYGFARAGFGHQVGAMRDSLTRHAAERAASGEAAWSEVVLPAADGLVAHARGDARRAVDKLAGVRDGLIRLGGSHAQRDLFDQILIDAALRVGDAAVAGPMLLARKRARPSVAVTDRLLARLAT